MRELVSSRENYDVISDEFINHPSKDEEKPPKKTNLTSQLSATKSSRSPRIKKVATIIMSFGKLVVFTAAPKSRSGSLFMITKITYFLVKLFSTIKALGDWAEYIRN